jgi:5-methylcytosine-specific restriction enzyme A
MPLRFDVLTIGDSYGRKTLASLWGYRGWNALGRGIFTPTRQNVIVLFVTKEKQKSLRQYRDHFEGDRLFMEGEDTHTADGRLANAEAKGVGIHLFYRELHHSTFVYYGQVHLESWEEHSDQPSSFIFRTARSDAIAQSALKTELIAHGGAFVPEVEGQPTIRQHVVYERSPKNRARAIEVHGAVCKACGFDFNLVYGPELARDYVEVHHVESITRIRGRVDPNTLLVPLCSNCHSMVHRKPGSILPVEELRRIMQKQRDGGKTR